MLSTLLWATATAAAATPSIVANSWGNNRIDVFGVSPNASIWHKFHTAQQFQPAGFENFLGKVSGTPSVVSWGENRLDYFVVGTNGSLYHRFWNWQGSVDNSSWTPWPYHEVLLGQNKGGDFVSPVGTASWGEGRLDVVGLTKNGSYLHAYFDGHNWQGWEDFGGNFSSVPAVVAWKGANRFDVFGTTVDGDILHKFWDGSRYTEWEKFDGPFIGAPVASSWGSPNLDLWALRPDGSLFHAVWRLGWYGTENLGGNFTSTPQVAHWAPGRIDLVGQFANETQYRHKYFEPYSSTWSDWAAKGGDFISQPALTSWADNQLNILGVARTGELQWQLWVGQWLPGFDTYYGLGNTSNPFASAKSVEAAEVRESQVVLGFKQGL